MIITKENPNYYIASGALQFVENALYNPDRVAVSLESGTVILVYIRGLIDYAADGNYRRWRLSGFNTLLTDPSAQYIYARLNRTDQQALVVFTPRQYLLSGKELVAKAEAEVTAWNEANPKSVDENGLKTYYQDGELNSDQLQDKYYKETGEESETYYWVRIGTITSNDESRHITYDSGLLGTFEQIYKDLDNSLFELFDGVGNVVNDVKKAIGVRPKYNLGFSSDSFNSAFGTPKPGDGVRQLTLADLSFVKIANPVSGESLVFDGTNWVNRRVQGTGGGTGGGASSFSELSGQASFNQLPGLYIGTTKVQSASAVQNLTGIGTITASGDNTITKSGTNQAKFAAKNDSGTIELLASSRRGLYDRTTTEWVVATNGTDTFMNRGKLGLGTENPQERLHVAGSIRFVDAVLSYSRDDNYAKINKGLASDSFVSAFGASATSILSMTLGDIDGVTISSPTIGQGLVYDGTKWVNQDIKTSGLADFSVTESGTGNVVTSVSYSSGVLSVGKGITAFRILDRNINLDGFADGSNVLGSIIINDPNAVSLYDSPSNYGHALQFGNSSSNIQLYISSDAKLYYRNRWWSANGGAWTKWRKLIYEGEKVANAEKADKLSVPRNIWGQSFDGSADVSGNMTGVGTISANGNNTITKTTTDQTYFRASNAGGAVELLMSETNRGLYNRTNTTWIVGSNGNDTFMMTGNVGVGLINPLHKLHVNGGVVASGYVSAFGASTTGLLQSNIGDLQDVTINTPSKGQSLVYDGAKWVNELVSGGSDLTVNDVGDGNAYTSYSFSKGILTLTKGSSFLQLTGGIVSNASSEFFTLKRNVVGGVFINFQDANGVIGKIGVHANKYPIFNNGTTTYEMYHSGNLPPYPTKESWNYDDVYAKKDGTGATGTWGISISGNAATATSATKLSTPRLLWGNSFDGSSDVKDTITFGGYNGNADRTEYKDIIKISRTDNTFPFVISYNGWGKAKFSSALTIDGVNGMVGIGTDSPSHKLHVDGGIVAKSYVSAFGTSSTGLQPLGLSDLTNDVLIANPAKDEALVFNGTKWINKKVASTTANFSVSMVGDGNAITSAVYSNGVLFLSKGSSFLHTTGGTITNSSSEGFITLNRTQVGGIFMVFRNTEGVIGKLGVHTNKYPIFSDGTTTYTIYHSGNLPAYPTKDSWNYDDVYLKLTGNAASASKLASPKTLWGQSFDGSANVSGNMSGVGQISANGNIIITKTADEQVIVRAANPSASIELLTGAVGSKSYANRGLYDRTLTSWIIGNDGTDTFAMIGNFGVGTTNPSEKLHVAGNVKSNGNIVAAGYVSAFGSSSTEQQMLGIGDLSNVNISNPVYGDSLVFDGSKWTNKPYRDAVANFSVAESGSGNAITSAVYSNGVLFLSKGSSFLHTTGGTITNSSSEGFITLNRTQVGGIFMVFRNPEGVIGKLGVHTNKYPIFSDGETTYTIYHSGNLPAYPTKESWNYDDVYLKLTDNAVSASKLANARTIWGQSFNGTANVSGNMTSVGTISANGNIVITKTTDEQAIFRASNTSASVELIAGAAGDKGYANRGLYDRTLTSWIVGTDGTDTYSMIGNFGIGTTNPTEKLHVGGNIKGRNILPSATQTYDVGSNTLAYNYGYYLGLYAPTGKDLDIAANDATGHIHIKSTGNVGVGTDSPSDKLHVNGVAKAQYYRFYGLDGSTNVGYVGRGSTSNDDVYLASSNGINFYAGGSRMYINSSGNVGIGTTDPSQKLDVNGSAAFGNSSYCDILLRRASTNYISANQTGGNIVFRVNGTTDAALSILANGNVGVGVASPASKLQVNGGITANGYVSAFGASSTAIDAQLNSVGIGIAPNASYKLYVSGTSRFNGTTNIYGATTIGLASAVRTLTVQGSIVQATTTDSPTTSSTSAAVSLAGGMYIAKSLRVAGSVYYGSTPSTLSDMRYKDVIEDRLIGINEMADAPLFAFKYKSGGVDKIGTSAQYWQGIMGEFVEGEDRLSLDYSALGVAMGISLAKHVKSHEERIAELEKENRELKRKLNIA